MKQDKNKKEETSLIAGGDYTAGSEDFVEYLKRSL